MENKDSQLTDDTEIKAYREKVKKHYQEKKIIEFDNSSTAHAEIVTEYLFKYAIENQEDIKIFTGNLKASFYNNFSQQAKTLLKKNKISIVCEKKCEHSSLKTLIENNNNGEILNINAQENTGISHFILAGDSAYRDEKSDILKTADASFNGRIRGSFLSALFNAIKKNISNFA